MALRPLYRPFRPDLDNFLYAAVGEERDGVPLSLVSAFARLDLDPWHEASRLASLAKPEAGAQLAETILRLGAYSPLPRARRIADELIELLPSRAQMREPAHGSRARGFPITPGKKTFWLVGLLLVALALAGMAATGDLLPFRNPALPEPLQSAPSDNFHPPVR